MHRFWLRGIFFIAAILATASVAQSSKISGVWNWEGHQGKLELVLEANTASGTFFASHGYSIMPEPSGSGGVTLARYEEWAVSGKLQGSYNPQSGDLRGTIAGTWDYEGMPEGRRSPFPATNSAPFSGSFSGRLSAGVLSGTWNATVGAAENPDSGIAQPPASLSGTLGAAMASRPPQCPEGTFFYNPDVLQGYYTDQPSLTFSREQLVQALVSALQQYRKEGGFPQSGVAPTDPTKFTNDPIDIAQALATGAMPTGKEAQLQTEVRKLAQGGKKVSPSEFFLLSLRANGGNVKQALLTAHAALYRDSGKKNQSFMAEGLLQPMRNPAGYSSKALPTGEAGRQTVVKDAVGKDEQGVWYHFFGMAALEFADSQSVTNIAPMFAVRFGGENFSSGSFADKIKQVKTVPISGLGGAISDLAVAVENAIRKDGSVPDPDKQCVNYSGIAAGKALSREFNLRQTDDIQRYQQQQVGPIANGTFSLRSPLSFEVLGMAGERVAYDQKTGRFSANTPLVIVDPYREPNGTVAMVVAPLFKVDKVTFVGTGNGLATVAFANSANKSGVYTLEARNGVALELRNWGGQTALVGANQAVIPLAQETRVFSNGNIYAVNNGPTAPTVVRLSRALHLTKIVDYHWNSAKGQTPGTIALRHENGTVYGPWKAVGSPGQGGVPNANWTATANATLPAGTYTVIDSHPASWAHNSASGGQGFTELWGYWLAQGQLFSPQWASPRLALLLGSLI